ncbi:OLC1v1011838C1 [Oldenlandia corymbosa var. corymbosa]|nr:OLC1v1011838C1 [Oldenlandia corymbosa var. corymbosa]
METLNSYWQFGDDLRGQAKVSEDQKWLVAASKLAEQTRLKGERRNNLDLSKTPGEMRPRHYVVGFQEDNKFETLNFSMLNLETKMNDGFGRNPAGNGMYNININTLYPKASTNNIGNITGTGKYILNSSSKEHNINGINTNHSNNESMNANLTDKRFKTLPAAETLPRNEVLGGYIFVCNNDTMQEDLKRQLFGLPPRYRDSVRAITPGLPLFLYNYTTHQLHGIFEASTFGGSNIDPTAWEDKKCKGESRFPAQVRIRIRKLCKPLEEDAFRPVLHHYDGPKFRLELSVPETLDLLDLCEQAGLLCRDVQNAFHDFPKKRKLGGEKYFARFEVLRPAGTQLYYPHPGVLSDREAELIFKVQKSSLDSLIPSLSRPLPQSRVQVSGFFSGQRRYPKRIKEMLGVNRYIVKLKDLSSFRNRRSLNFIGVVVEYSVARRSTGTDYCTILKIIDQHQQSPELCVNIFMRSIDQLPHIRAHKDIILLCDFKVESFNDTDCAVYDHKKSSFALFDGDVTNDFTPYQASPTFYLAPSDAEFVRRLRNWSHITPFDAGISNYAVSLKDLGGRDFIDLVCKVLHVSEVSSGKWMLFVWDGTDIPALEFSTKLGADELNPVPLQVEPMILPASVLSKFPCIGTVLRIVIDECYENFGCHFKIVNGWVRIRNLHCRTVSGLWKGVWTGTTKVRHLSEDDNSVTAVMRKYTERSMNYLPPHTSSNPLTDVEENVQTGFTTIMKLLTSPVVHGKVKCIVRFVAVHPSEAKDIMLPNGEYRMMRVTVEDPTARIHASLSSEDAVIFFGGHPETGEVANKMSKLLGISAETGTNSMRNPPWTECCVGFSSLDESNVIGSRHCYVASFRSPRFSDQQPPIHRRKRRFRVSFSTLEAAASSLPEVFEFRNLDADDFRHPLDRQNTLLLRAIPGLKDIGKALLGTVAEQVMLLENIATSILVTESQLPELYSLMNQASKILNIEAPDLYVRQSPVPNAYTLAVSGKKPFIVVHTSLIELLTRKELQAVLAHELGHLKCDHGVWLTFANLLTLGAYNVPGFGGLIAQRLEEQLFRWLRAAELTCDRAALLVAQDPKVVISVLMKLAGGCPSLADQLNVDAFLEQARSYDKASSSPVGWYIAPGNFHILFLFYVHEKLMNGQEVQSTKIAGAISGGIEDIISSFTNRCLLYIHGSSCAETWISSFLQLIGLLSNLMFKNTSGPEVSPQSFCPLRKVKTGVFMQVLVSQKCLATDRMRENEQVLSENFSAVLDLEPSLVMNEKSAVEKPVAP